MGRKSVQRDMGDGQENGVQEGGDDTFQPLNAVLCLVWGLDERWIDLTELGTWRMIRLSHLTVKILIDEFVEKWPQQCRKILACHVLHVELEET